MSCGVPALPNGIPVWATSFGSIGTLRPAELAIFVQIGVSMSPGWTVLTRILSPAAAHAIVTALRTEP
jgi:hypothetical protein